MLLPSTIQISAHDYDNTPVSFSCFLDDVADCEGNDIIFRLRLTEETRQVVPVARLSPANSQCHVQSSPYERLNRL